MRQSLLTSPSFLRALIVSAGAVVLATIAAFGLQDFFAVYTLSNIYLLAVLVAALFGGIRGGLLTALLSFLSYNFYFMPPRFTLSVTDPNDLFALFMYLVAALITGGLAGKIREHYVEVERRSELMQTIADFSGRLSATTTVADIVAVVSRELVQRWQCRHWILQNEGDTLSPIIAWPDKVKLPEHLIDEFKTIIAIPATAPVYLSDAFLCLPLKINHGSPCFVVFEKSDLFLAGSEDRRLLDTMLVQALTAMERAAFAQESQRARAAVDEERLRSSLLSSVSHDLRTPLASIIGSASTLRQFNATLDSQTRLELSEAIEDEAMRLSRFVDQLLIVTRTEHSLVGAGELLDLGEILYSAVMRARRYFDRHVINISIQQDVPAIVGYPSLLEQSLFNLIENAAKYAPVGSRIDVALLMQEEWIDLVVSDEGPGIPVHDQARIFDKFVRLNPDGPRRGSGLGLTISRNIADLMQAGLSVESPIKNGLGARFVMRFRKPSEKTNIELRGASGHVP